MINLLRQKPPVRLIVTLTPVWTAAPKFMTPMVQLDPIGLGHHLCSCEDRIVYFPEDECFLSTFLKQ